MNIEIKHIELTDRIKAENYPHSGFFLAKEGKMIDLVFANQKTGCVHFVAPYQVFIDSNTPEVSKKEGSSEVKEGFVDQNFILDFAGILLNRKR